jgi:hypothetical protein
MSQTRKITVCITGGVLNAVFVSGVPAEERYECELIDMDDAEASEDEVRDAAEEAWDALSEAAVDPDSDVVSVF